MQQKKNTNTIYKITKRLFDFWLSLVLIIVFSPLILAISVAIKVTSPGTVLYKGKRAFDERSFFYIYKFRSMVQNAEQLGGPSTALNDSRLTSIGRFIRKYKLDELPQLINILKGEMSFVGPRPQVEKYTSLYAGEELLILSAKPGLTDYASIYFVDMDSVLGGENADEVYASIIEPVKNKLRLKYIYDQSWGTDLKILFGTFSKLLGFNVGANLDKGL